MRTSLTLLAVVLALGCQSAPLPKKSAPLTSAPARADGVLVSLERGACFGRCPIYRVEVLNDGAVRFKGERFVKVTEPVTARLEAAALAKLTARLEQSGFALWSDFTNRQVTDMATVVLTFRGKSIHHYVGDEKAPAELTQLENDVDALIGTGRWVNGTGAETQ